MKKWKFLFWFMACITVLNIVSLPFEDDLDFVSFLAIVFWCLLLIPLYGFAFKVAIGNKAIATALFVLNVVVPGCLGLFFGVVYTIENFSLIQLAFSLGTLAFLAFLSYPIFMYAFRSNEIWSRNA